MAIAAPAYVPRHAQIPARPPWLARLAVFLWPGLPVALVVAGGLLLAFHPVSPVRVLMPGHYQLHGTGVLVCPGDYLHRPALCAPWKETNP